MFFVLKSLWMIYSAATRDVQTLGNVSSLIVFLIFAHTLVWAKELNIPVFIVVDEPSISSYVN
jgi:hypothetical protein